MTTATKLTERQERLLGEARISTHGVVRVCNLDLRTARQLEAKGHGHITSNPGANYTGLRIPREAPTGGYYVAPGVEFDQVTKSFVRK